MFCDIQPCELSLKGNLRRIYLFFSGGEPLFLLQCRWKFAKLYVVKISITAHYVCKYKVKPGIRELINTKCLVINYISLWLL